MAGSPLRSGSPGAAQVHLAGIQLHVLPLLEDTVDHWPQDLMQIGHAHELGAGGTTQGGAEGEAGACPRAGGGEATQGDVQREAGGLPPGWARGATQGEASHQGPSLAAQGHLRPAKLWAPSKHWEGSPREKTAAGPPTSSPGLHPLTFINCSIDLDARELERKRVLGSAERTGRSVC